MFHKKALDRSCNIFHQIILTLFLISFSTTNYNLYRDEKTVLLNQIATLQSQQVALGSRVESLTQTSENAITREREAEDRLDAVLSQHARQISQRQVSPFVLLQTGRLCLEPALTMLHRCWVHVLIGKGG